MSEMTLEQVRDRCIAWIGDVACDGSLSGAAANDIHAMFNVEIAARDAECDHRWVTSDAGHNRTHCAKCQVPFPHHLAQPAQAVDVGAIREVIFALELQSNLHFVDLADKLTRALSGEKAGPVGDGAYYGKDCPAGKVQVEFVGCDPASRYSAYGWKPQDSAFIELYVDGQRFRIDAGSIDPPKGNGKCRGIRINFPVPVEVDRHSANALDIYLPASPAPDKE